MGNTQAQGMAEAVQEGWVDLRAALYYNLTANHYPPLPVELLDYLEPLINRLNEQDLVDDVGMILDEIVEFPSGDKITNLKLMDDTHSWDFVHSTWN